MLLVQLIVIGLVAGFLGGLLGIGGSIIMIPAMTEVLGPNQHLYQAAAMIVNVFVVLPALYQHRRVGALDYPTVRKLVPLGLVGVLAGVALSEWHVFSGQGEAYLRILFGAFLLIIGVVELYRLLAVRPLSPGERPAPQTMATLSPPPSRSFSWKQIAGVALPTGLIAGLFGVGGGTVSVPLQRRIMDVPMRSAIVNSAALMLATAFVGALFKNAALARQHGSAWDPLFMAALLIPTAIIGSYQGSWLTHRLPVRTIRAVFYVLLVITALRMISSACAALPAATAT